MTERERHTHARTHARGSGEQPEQHMFNISPMIITSHSQLIMERLQDARENRHTKKNRQTQTGKQDIERKTDYRLNYNNYYLGRAGERRRAETL